MFSLFLQPSRPNGAVRRRSDARTLNRRLGAARLALLGGVFFIVAILFAVDVSQAQEMRRWRDRGGKTVATGVLDVEKTLAKMEDAGDDVPTNVYFYGPNRRSFVAKYRSLSPADRAEADRLLGFKTEETQPTAAASRPTASRTSSNANASGSSTSSRASQTSRASSAAVGSRRMSDEADASDERALAAVSTAEASGVRRAILIGVDDYVEFGDLRYASADVELMRARLVELGFAPENIVVLSTEVGRDAAAYAPTYRNIKRELLAFLESAGPDDTLFAMFTGHGFQTKNYGGYDAYVGFAPQDVASSEETTVDFATTISLSKFFDDMEACSAKFKWTLVDACRENIGGSSRRLIDASKTLRPLEAPRGVVALQSCGANEFSYESEELGHGLFTYRFVESLSEVGDANGDGVVTMLEAFMRTQAEVKRETSSDRAAYAKTQTPYCRGDFTDFPLAEVAVVSDVANVEAQAQTTAAQTSRPSATGGRVNTNYVAKSLNEPNLPAGARYVTKIAGVEYAYRWCPPGKFLMGSPLTRDSYEEGRYDNETQQEVTLTKGFWILETEVTRAMWEPIMRDAGDAEGPNFPIEGHGGSLSGNDGYYQAFSSYLGYLNQKFPEKGWYYTIPTEAQWEYACRAGTTTPFSWGSTLNGDKANCDGSKPYGATEAGKKSEGPSEVRSYEPNAWGIYDMHGNLWECAWTCARSAQPVVDPPVVDKGDCFERVIWRGGSWKIPAADCRSAVRTPYAQTNGYGAALRFVLVPKK